MKVPVIKVTQNDNDIFIFAIEANFLLDIVSYNPRDNDKEDGIQRLFKIEKGKAIAKYIDNENPVIPNNIIINLNLEKIGLNINDIYKNGIIDFDLILATALKKDYPKNQIAFVIDGQHRLRAFEYSQNKDFKLIISALINRSLAEMAEIFVKINYNQTPVSKSRALDLISLGENVFPEYKDHHTFTKKLNENIESPFYNQIKMLGLGDGIISQASIIDSIEKFKLVKTLNSLSLPPFQNDNLYNIIWIYFDVIKQKYSKCWESRDSTLTKTLGIRALFKTLNHILLNYSENKIIFSKKNIENSFINIDEQFWYSEPVSTLGGEKGVNLLYNLILEKI